MWYQIKVNLKNWLFNVASFLLDLSDSSPPQFVPVVEAMAGEVSDTEEEVGRQEERRDHPT